MKRNALFIAISLLAGILFFTSLHRIWPLLDADFFLSADEVETHARSTLEQRGSDLDGYTVSYRVRVNESLLDYLEQNFAPGRIQEWVRSGAPITYYDVSFKKPGDPKIYSVEFTPSGDLLSWSESKERDEPGDSITRDDARIIADSRLPMFIDDDTEGWKLDGESTQEELSRLDHHFTFVRTLSDTPLLRETLSATVSGSEVTSVALHWEVPAHGRRAARAKYGIVSAIAQVGFALAAIGIAIAFYVFLTHWKNDRIEGRACLLTAAVIFMALMGANLLQVSSFHLAWDPLVPRGMNYLRQFSLQFIFAGAMAVLLFVFIGAGDGTDRGANAGRRDSLWKFVSGRWRDRSVFRASWRGFLIGLLCGGTLAAGLWLAGLFSEVHVSFQPRGFFFYGINSAVPSLALVLFFLFIAMAEELGYRFFGVGWLNHKTGRPIIAICIPAVIYGLAHTNFSFLPPSEPIWVRPLLLTAVGIIWGWAFLRFDALTVVLSHYTADLFIFSWPRLGSGEPTQIAASLIIFTIPLWPFFLGLIFRPRNNDDAGDVNPDR